MTPDTSPDMASEPVILSELEDRIVRACLRYQFTTVLDHYYLHGCPPSLNQYRRVMARKTSCLDISCISTHFQRRGGAMQPEFLCLARQAVNSLTSGPMRTG